MKHFHIQLQSADGTPIITAGGFCYVAVNGANNKQTLYNKDGSALANPIALNRGAIDFHTGNDVNQVDLYVQSPTGHFAVAKNVKPSGQNEIVIDTLNRHQTMVIPFSIADTTATTETDTGFDCPGSSLILPNPAVLVETLDATETIDVGTATAETGDPNGFLALASVNAAGLIKGTLASTGQTIGALLSADESGAGVLVPEAHVSAGKSIVYTLTAGTDTAAGKIILPYVIANF